MKDKLDRFIANLNGQFIEVSDSSNKLQCMDLVYCFVFALDIPKATIQRLYAYEVFTKANDFTREYFDIIQNSPEFIPQDGDIGVFNKTSGNPAGHIVVCLGGGTTSKFRRFEQNSPLGTNAHISEGGYTNFLGVLRPKNVTIEGVPNWFKTLLQENNLTLADESKIRTLVDKAKKYDDDINSLKNQLISTDEALAKRATEVAMLREENQKLSTRVEVAEEERDTARGEKDKMSWENEKLVLKVKTLVEEVEKLEKLVATVTAQNAELSKNVLSAVSSKKLLAELTRRLLNRR